MAFDLCLGTARFQGPYGATGSGTTLPYETMRDIVKAALDNGVRWFDTAYAYGGSQEVLGLALRDLNAEGIARVVTKANTINQLIMSKQYFGHPFAAVLAHGKKYDTKVVNGVSVYDPEEVDELLDPICGMSTFQIPLSPANRAMLKSGVLDRIGSRTVMIRSVLLQGLLAIDPRDELADFHPEVLSKRWWPFCERIGMRPLEAAMGFAASVANKYGFVVVFGAETPAQVDEIVKAAVPRFDWMTCECMMGLFADMDPAEADPRRWRG